VSRHGLGGDFAVRFIDDSPLEGTGFEPSVALAVRFVNDSPLEEQGFEPSVPPARVALMETRRAMHAAGPRLGKAALHHEPGRLPWQHETCWYAVREGKTLARRPHPDDGLGPTTTRSATASTTADGTSPQARCLADAAGHLGGDQTGTQAEKRVIDRLAGPAVVDDRAAHAFDRFLGTMPPAPAAFSSGA
jgi:hypothetical protein